MEEYYQPVSLAGNDVVHLACGFLHVNQRVDHLLRSLIENQTFEGFPVPFHSVEVLNEQLG